MPIFKSINENRILAYILIVVFTVAFTSLFYLRSAMNANERDVLAPPKTVNVQTVELQDAYEVEDFYTGRIEPNRKTLIAFERSGLVLKVNVQEGQKVQEGEVIATLDTSGLKTRKEQLQAQKDQLESSLELAEANVTRQESLYKKKFSSQRNFDEVRTNRDIIKGQLDEVKAGLDSIEIDLEKSDVKAPFAGVVSTRLIDEGAVVNAGTPLIELLESEPVFARVGLPPVVAGTLQVGQTFTINLNGGSQTIILRALRSDLEEATRTVSALFELPNVKTFTFGQLIRLNLKRPVEGKGAWIPVTALIEGQKGLWNVFVANPESEEGLYQVARESIEIIHSTEDQAYVRGTLKQGQLVVADGTHKVIPGSTVKIKKG